MFFIVTIYVGIIYTFHSCLQLKKKNLKIFAEMSSQFAVWQIINIILGNVILLPKVPIEI